MSQKSTLRRFLGNVYGFSFFDKLTFLSPVYAIFMQSHGVSDMQLSFLFILFSVGTIISQPTVVRLTAMLGPRPTLVLGQLLKIAAFILWVLWPTWIGFMAGMFIWGMQSGFYAVTFEGMLYDELSARRHSDMYTRVLGGRYNAESLGLALSAAGSLMMFWGYGWVTAASVGTILVSIFMILRMRLRSVRRHQMSGTSPVRMVKLLGRGMRVAWKTPCVMTTMMLALVVLNFSYLEDYLGPIGLQIGLPVQYVGIMQFFVLGASMVGQALAYHFSRIRDWILYALIFVGGVCFIAFGQMYSLGALWTLGVAYIVFKGSNVLLYSRFQQAVPARYRSVMLSLYTTLNHAIYIGICLVIGWGGKMGSWRYSILILGLMLAGVGLGALGFMRNRCDVSRRPLV